TPENTEPSPEWHSQLHYSFHDPLYPRKKISFINGIITASLGVHYPEIVGIHICEQTLDSIRIDNSRRLIGQRDLDPQGLVQITKSLSQLIKRYPFKSRSIVRMDQNRKTPRDCTALDIRD